jgi:hypothetical protein
VLVPKSVIRNPNHHLLLVECIQMRMVGNPAGKHDFDDWSESGRTVTR